ncbi:DUF1624 domain-containing protein [Aureimonas fodinaquatilis]|uniref:DUF1624 domain-containing protein n=1 Tax=Aureimonas fodinaquatilis TaxID=2565783 RepID=A0A5B0DXN6_9HYPH|nr:heparan-alpha-glucosaminide N-acetyltransferase [Aureimonas fodinaquatilis]KAA0970511.1 DUF1624 domain-containing protein [Aureimonas fodinaquatilis]
MVEKQQAKRGRIEVLDLTRGVALVAMAIYHFTWDLEFFGYVASGTANSGAWRLFARGIASSFLLIVGMSLVLANMRGLHWPGFLKRLAQIVAAALTITVVTYIIMPNSFVFFGILHQIAIASLIGLFFLRLPFGITLISGLVVIALPNLFSTDLMNPRYLAWIGFAAREPFSNDIVPVFPWTGIVLLGIAAGQWLGKTGGWLRLKALNPAILSTGAFSPLRWIGRHSLAFYLLHQPVSLALIGTYAAVFPPDRTQEFVSECQTVCGNQGQDAQICQQYCGCVAGEIAGTNLLEAYLANSISGEKLQLFEEKILTCSAKTIP